MEKFTITIAREFGSMGRSIAKELSEELGVAFYDRDIVEAVSKQLNLPVSTVSDVEEKAKNHLFARKFPLGTDEEYMQDMVFDTQKKLIRELAEKSSCIFVGRCSDFILEQEKNNINIYIYASRTNRLKNCVEHLDMTEDEAGRMMASVDRARSAYHRKYAGYLPSDPEHKNLMIDSSLLGVCGTAQMIARVVREVFPG